MQIRGNAQPWNFVEYLGIAKCYVELLGISRNCWEF